MTKLLPSTWRRSGVFRSTLNSTWSIWRLINEQRLHALGQGHASPRPDWRALPAWPGCRPPPWSCKHSLDRPPATSRQFRPEIRALHLLNRMQPAHLPPHHPSSRIEPGARGSATDRSRRGVGGVFLIYFFILHLDVVVEQGKVPPTFFLVSFLPLHHPTPARQNRARSPRSATDAAATRDGGRRSEVGGGAGRSGRAGQGPLPFPPLRSPLLPLPCPPPSPAAAPPRRRRGGPVRGARSGPRRRAAGGQAAGRDASSA